MVDLKICKSSTLQTTNFIMAKSFQSIVKVEFAYNNFEADSIEEYIDCVKTQFLEEYNIELSDSEITEIEEIENV